MTVMKRRSYRGGRRSSRSGRVVTVGVEGGVFDHELVGHLDGAEVDETRAPHAKEEIIRWVPEDYMD